MAPTTRTALLSLDLQVQMVGLVPAPDDYLARCNAALDTARQAGLTVVHVRIAFRPGHPEVSPANLMFAHIAAQDGLVEGAEATNLHPGLRVEPSDVVVKKARACAFSGGDLEVVLRARRIEALALFGITTSGGVLSTVRHAADLDYELTVLEDLCFDFDAEAHRVLLGNVFPRQARVVSGSDWHGSIAG